MRLALGAHRWRVLAGVVGEGLVLVLLGVGVGLPVALLGARSLEHQLFEVVPGDVTTVVVASLILVGTGLLACAVPALRATRVDPLQALRWE